MNTKAQSSLSIIIISYNTKKITDDCLASVYYSLHTAPFDYEVIVVDNNSKDGSREMLQKWKEKKKTVVIENNENVGFGKANNQAVKLAKGRYILLLNSDIVVLEKAIQSLFAYYQANEKKVQFVGGKLLNKDMTPQASAGRFYSPGIVFAWLFLKGDHWGITRSSPNTPQATDWVSGACILTKKEYFIKLNGLDEGIFMYMEEVDLLYRAKKQGYRVYFYPHARFIHLGSASSDGRTFPILQAYRGLLYFYKKHYGAKDSFLLRCMLKLKALAGIIFGHFLNNEYLKKTYAQAYKMV